MLSSSACLVPVLHRLGPRLVVSALQASWTATEPILPLDALMAARSSALTRCAVREKGLYCTSGTRTSMYEYEYGSYGCPLQCSRILVLVHVIHRDKGIAKKWEAGTSGKAPPTGLDDRRRCLRSPDWHWWIIDGSLMILPLLQDTCIRSTPYIDIDREDSSRKKDILSFFIPFVATEADGKTDGPSIHRTCRV